MSRLNQSQGFTNRHAAPNLLNVTHIPQSRITCSTPENVEEMYIAIGGKQFSKSLAPEFSQSHHVKVVDYSTHSLRISMRKIANDIEKIIRDSKERKNGTVDSIFMEQFENEQKEWIHGKVGEKLRTLFTTEQIEQFGILVSDVVKKIHSETEEHWKIMKIRNMERSKNFENQLQNTVNHLTNHIKAVQSAIEDMKSATFQYQKLIGNFYEKEVPVDNNLTEKCQKPKTLCSILKIEPRNPLIDKDEVKVLLIGLQFSDIDIEVLPFSHKPIEWMKASVTIDPSTCSIDLVISLLEEDLRDYVKSIEMMSVGYEA